MDPTGIAIQHGLYATVAALSFVSAVFPLVNAELVVLALAAGLPHPNTLLLIAVATGAQMAGKSTMYWIGRRASSLNQGKPGRYAEAIERWGDRFRRSPKSVGALIFVSAASGLPPFYIISTLAGAFRTNFAAFILTGSVGRFLHFAAVGLLPAAVRSFAA